MATVADRRRGDPAGHDPKLAASIPSALPLSAARIPPSPTSGSSRLPPISPSRARAAHIADAKSASPNSTVKPKLFDEVRFAEYIITPWHHSPYPIAAPEPPPVASSSKSNGALALSHPPLSTLARDSGSSTQTKKRKVDIVMPPPPLPENPKRAKGVDSDVPLGPAPTQSPQSLGKLWVCDLCFKYFRSKPSWQHHYTACDVLQPPGRMVYQKGSYSIYEVDGAQAPLYCQNLSLFGKLFIDVKSLFFHVENFLYYVVCDACTSKRDQVMAFFSKEKHSYDDNNLACIITFPQYQGKGFGRLLMEFSYFLTLHPATRPSSLSPGTPERPLSELGLKGYMAYWSSVILRFCRKLLDGAPALPDQSAQIRPPRRASQSHGTMDGTVTVNGISLVKMRDGKHKDQHHIKLTLKDMARACHLRADDVAYTLGELGMLRHRVVLANVPITSKERDLSDWSSVEVVITRDAVDDLCIKWKVKDRGVLDASCVLL